MIVHFFINEDGLYQYHIKALNGNVMLTSSTYSTYRKCVEGWRTVQKALRIEDFFVIRYRWARGM